MLKKTINYTDFDGVEKSEDFYFNLTKAECIELQLSAGGEGGFADVMQDMVEKDDKAAMVATFKDIIMRSYGVRTGGGFIKSPEHSAAFATTEAYSALFMELMSGDANAVAFLRGIMPKDLVESADKLEPAKPSRLDAQVAMTASSFEEQKVNETKRIPISKADLLLKMAIKAGKPVNLDQRQVEMLSQSELEQALANGSQIDGVTL